MPAKAPSKNPSVGANVLSKMAEAGVESEVLLQRQRYAVAKQALSQYIGPLGFCQCGHPESDHGTEACGEWLLLCNIKNCPCIYFTRRSRSYPHFLPTQANGRWSTTDPPITNFPKQCYRVDCPHREPGLAHSPISDECWDAHRVYKPDPGWYWISWDKDAIEARVNAVLTEDAALVAAFTEGQDVHTITACATFGLPIPPNVFNPHSSVECKSWRREVNWGGKEDLRRRLAKVQRYGCFYGPDETAILGAKGVEELGLPRNELLERTRAYLASQPLLQKMKEKMWDQFIRVPEARTHWGRRLRCYPTYQEKENWIKSLKAYRAGRGSMRPGDAQKVLWNFLHSAFVSDLINKTLVDIKARWPESRLVLNKHDSLTVAFPERIDPWPEIRQYDELVVTFTNGLTMPFTSTWYKVFSNGTLSRLI
jgi:DNA polymerase family A